MHLFTIIKGVIQIYNTHMYISTKPYLRLSPIVDEFKNPKGYFEIYKSP